MVLTPMRARASSWSYFFAGYETDAVDLTAKDAKSAKEGRVHRRERRGRREEKIASFEF
jgi:hypothetical protein